MKKFIAIWSMIFVVGIIGTTSTGCRYSTPKPEPRHPRSHPRTTTLAPSDYTIKIIDGCEYIERTKRTTNGIAMTSSHKGNCNNKIHNRSYSF